MKYFSDLSKKEKSIFFLLLLGFLLKYNYFYWYIFQTISIYTLLIKNIVVILIFLLSLNLLLKSKKKLYQVFFFYLIFTTFFFANYWYNRYFGNYLSIADMTMGQGIRPFKVLFRQLIGWIDLLFIFELPVLVYLIFFNGDFSKETKSISNNRNYRKKVLIILLLIIVLLGAHIYHISNLYAVNGFLKLYEHSTPAFVSVYGIIPLYIAEFISMQTKEPENIKQASEEEIVGEEELSQEYEIENIKNIIVIQLESFDEKIIDFQHNGQPVTPFLNKIKQHSLYFDNIYAQHVNGSFDAEFSFLTSLYPINKNYVFKTNDMTEFNSLVKVLKKRDYQILAFHGNDGDFFYRNKGYSEMGFDHFYSREDFSIENAEIGKESYLGINDYDFFDQSFQYLEQSEEPFFAFYITVTSHTPFDFYPEEYGQEEFSDLNPTIVKDYLNSVYFTDQSLKNFFAGLKERGLYEDTLFVFYADHSSDIKKESYNSGNNFYMKGNTNTKEPENITMMLFHPELEAETIHKTGTHADIATTILDIMGDREKPEGFLGVSLLKETENPVLFLHEIPQILYHNNLFLRMPKGPEKESEFRRVALKNENTEEVSLPETEKERMLNVINYMQEIMKKNISEEEN
ncbi:lipoteichoic acid synthase [Halanaerobium saccharolyticum]|uniref:Lipoteichoic acid synthase n=1 Tax=Halanaerobium saccharolyticum TaxID=43595 RepID=A0A4V3G5R0_9FIRM|nr:LTA synthase family protein [Halanaerobium saccharolyticum]RAK09341.1 lipoteichoic acid synthase [Halanaerobium saccharolyticum]TDW06200.1 lipoteichoic acid synthase [Halanaerobium saccharolyticum]TDX60994.1 lipoteichoic acid synthase [Halanaerobium saccharolyticum]